jgi:hypothetical protein
MECKIPPGARSRSLAWESDRQVATRAGRVMGPHTLSKEEL